MGIRRSMSLGGVYPCVAVATSGCRSRPLVAAPLDLLLTQAPRLLAAASQRRYNEQRPHMALGWKTPAEYRAAHLPKEVRQAA